MEKKTINDVLSTYLKEQGFSTEDAADLIKKFHTTAKDKKKEEETEETELRTGTSCFGVISKKHDEVLFEN